MRVMTLRTPRRRISPRAKRRYRAIREFFRRALGTNSQQDIKISSSIAVNVTDLKTRIIGIERQLNEVNQHCQDLAGLETSFRREAQQLHLSETQHESNKPPCLSHQIPSNSANAAYKISQTNTNPTVNAKPQANCGECQCEPVILEDYHAQLANARKQRKCKERKQRSDLERDRSSHKNRSDMQADQCVTNSYQSVNHERSQHQHDQPSPPHTRPPSPSNRRSKRHHRSEQFANPPEHTETLHQDEKRKKHRERKKRHRLDPSPSRYYEEPRRKSHKEHPTIDTEFIADLIKKQYPTKMFGRRGSELSQFSAPVCRDHEYMIRNDIQEGTELCSCCYNQRDCHERRSVCDTRLYSSNRHPHYLRRHRRYEDIYNDAAYYDVIPVREKASPKFRRKFVEGYLPEHQYRYPYKEVPPCPRTNRPRLNLTAQYQHYDIEDLASIEQPLPRRAPKRPQPEAYYGDVEEASEAVSPSCNEKQPKSRNPAQRPSAQVQNQDIGTTSSGSPYPNLSQDQNTDLRNNPKVNRTEKTADRALNEIKDILQNFLHEIKREGSQLHCEKNDVSNNIENRPSNVSQGIRNCVSAHRVAHSCGNPNNCSSFIPSAVAPTAAQVPASFVSPYPAPCCYPMVCPVNYLQSSYVIPSASMPACHRCASNTKDVYTECSKGQVQGQAQGSYDNTKSKEIDDLIKEVCKHIAEDHLAKRRGRKKHYERSTMESRDRDVTSQSVGGSIRPMQDMKTGTPRRLWYHSRSCEAIGSTRRISPEYYASNTQSDTVLDKLSLEATSASSVTQLSSVSVLRDKNKMSKIVQILKSVGFLKKKKKMESSEEVTNNESTETSEARRRATPPPPFRQNITNYMMHEQDYYQRAPVEYSPEYPPRSYPPRAGHPPRPEYPPSPYEPKQYYHGPDTGDFTPHHVHHQTIHEHAPPGHYGQPSAPPYPGPPYDPHYYMPPYPQPPLCLKEVEVKSISTQSEKKFSFFQRFTKKQRMPTFRSESNPRYYSQTQITPPKRMGYYDMYEPPKKEKKGFFETLKNLQNKDFRTEIPPIPVTQGFAPPDDEMKIGNALIKKMFYKKNPFSTRNMLVRALMGKDKATMDVSPMLLKRGRLMF